MKSPDMPTPFGPLSEAGQTWAQRESLPYATDTTKQDIKNLYVDGTLLWQAQRRRVTDLIEQGDGIKKINRASFCDGLNYVELENGQLVYVSEFLKAPILSVNAWSGTTPTVNAPFIQSHELQVAFGGSRLGGSISRPDWSINEQLCNVTKLEATLRDDSFLPEEMGVIESVTTTLALLESDDKETSRNHASSVHYSLFGRREEANKQPMPNPYPHRVAYREWAFGTDAQIDLIFKAPIIEQGSTTPGAAVINQYGYFQPNGEVALASLDRFQSLLAYYATHQYPDLFPVDQEQSLEYLVEQLAKLT
jgi:hypothetical protein